MTQQTIHKLTKRAQKLLALEALILADEREWYQSQLNSILIRLEAFNQEIRSQYGTCIADIMQLDTIPHDIVELASLIAKIKQQLHIETKKITHNRFDVQPTNRYSFFSA